MAIERTVDTRRGDIGEPKQPQQADGVDTAKPKSTFDIASLIMNVPSEGTSDQDGGTDSEPDDAGPDDGQLDFSFEEEGDDDADDDASRSATGYDADDDDDGGDDDSAASYRDDDLVQFDVNGKVVEVSLGDLKKAYAGDKSAQDRIKEADEKVKKADATYRDFSEQMEAARTDFVNVVSRITNQLVPEFIKPPDASLRQSDPQKYLMQQDAYNKDQERIRRTKSAIQQELQKQVEDRKKKMADYRKKERTKLFEALPELSDEKKGPEVAERIQNLALDLGFTPKELAAASDHRLFIMAHKAAMYDHLKSQQKTEKGKGKKGDPKDPSEGTTKKLNRPRRLRPGGTAKATAAMKQQTGRQKQQVDAAKKSGKPQDIAATILVPQTNRKGARRGR